MLTPSLETQTTPLGHYPRVHGTRIVNRVELIRLSYFWVKLTIPIRAIDFRRRLVMKSTAHPPRERSNK